MTSDAEREALVRRLVVCAVYTDDEATGAPNAPLIVAAINFIRSPEFAGLVKDARRWRWAVAYDADEEGQAGERAWDALCGPYVKEHIDECADQAIAALRSGDAEGAGGGA